MAPAAPSFPRLARVLLLLAVSLGALSLGACRDRYVVRHAATPNPLRAVRTFAAEPLLFEARIEGKSEGDWVAKQNEERRRAWPAGKTAMMAAFSRGLATDAQAGGLAITAAPGAPGTHRIRAVVRHVEPGSFDGPTSTDTMVEVDVEILSPEGMVLDAITSRAVVPATALNLDLEDRLRDAAKNVGENVARYLRDRTGT
ncbi:MAG: hypothetical protein ABI175_19880 [Polyangiales bacterium]